MENVKNAVLGFVATRKGKIAVAMVVIVVIGVLAAHGV